MSQHNIHCVRRRRGRPRLRWIDNNREDMTKYELTADMTENRQYWKMMVKTGPQRSGDGLFRWERVEIIYIVPIQNLQLFKCHKSYYRFAILKHNKLAQSEVSSDLPSSPFPFFPVREAPFSTGFFPFLSSSSGGEVSMIKAINLWRPPFSLIIWTQVINNLSIGFLMILLGRKMLTIWKPDRESQECLYKEENHHC